MDLDICEWVNYTFGRDRGKGEKALVLGLKDAVNLLLRRSEKAMELLTKHHTAGADAQMHRLLYIALRVLSANARV